MADKFRLYQVEEVQLALLKSNPPQLSVSVIGWATSSGWRDAELVPMEKTLSPDGILDLDFVAVPPDGISLTMLTRVAASLVWPDAVERLVGVKIYARGGDVIQLLPQPAGNGGAQAFATTLAVGEEDRPPQTTLRLGEEGPFPSTRAIGEEGPTTFALGEEGLFPKTWRRGEEGPWPKTMRLGEEGPKPWFGESDPRGESGSTIGGEDWDWPGNDTDPFGR